METLGQRIKRLREQKRWSQQDLALAVNVSARTIGNWENDRAHPRASIGALEDAFGVSLTAPAEAVDEDAVKAALWRSALTEDRRHEVYAFYTRKLREQAYEDEGRRGA